MGKADLHIHTSYSYDGTATVPAAEAERLLGKALEHEYPLEDLLRRPGVGFDAVSEVAAMGGSSPEHHVSRETLRAAWGQREADAVIEQAEIAIKYAGYIDRQAEQVARFRKLEDRAIPPHLDYTAMPQLRMEAREKLSRIRPANIGQAGRVSGITPADLAVLLFYLD